MAARVFVFATIKPGTGKEFEEAFEVVRPRVSTVKGHVFDELLKQQSDGNAYLLVSEWESKEAFETWRNAPAHDEMTAPMHPYFAQRSELRYYDVISTAR